MSDTDLERERGAASPRPPTPRWVKVFGIIVIVLILLVGIVLLTGIGGEHGPGRHTPSNDSGSMLLTSIMAGTAGSSGGPAAHTLAASVTEHRAQRP